MRRFPVLNEFSSLVQKKKKKNSNRFYVLHAKFVIWGFSGQVLIRLNTKFFVYPRFTVIANKFYIRAFKLLNLLIFFFLRIKICNFSIIQSFLAGNSNSKVDLKDFY